MKINLTSRELRLLRALMNGPVMRENADRIAGCSNSPELVRGLRHKGLEIPCERVERFDRDGNTCWPGLYQLTPADKAIARDWLK